MCILFVITIGKGGMHVICRTVPAQVGLAGLNLRAMDAPGTQGSSYVRGSFLTRALYLRQADMLKSVLALEDN
jgi:hypothetical protein